MSTTAERIIDALQKARSPLDDDQLASYLGVRRQQVNQACRRLASQNLLRRAVGAGGKITNWLDGSTTASARQPAQVVIVDGFLAEDEVKQAVKEHLEKSGYRVVVRWGRERGVDIEALGDGVRWLIEAKGEVGSGPQQVNYFLNALGELVQRMDDPCASYGIALPDNQQYRRLIARLPSLAGQRLRLTSFFVRRTPTGLTVDVEELWSS